MRDKILHFSLNSVKTPANHNFTLSKCFILFINFYFFFAKNCNGNADVFLLLHCAQTRLHYPPEMPITYRLSPWFYVAFSCQDWLMSQRGLVLYFPLLKHQRQRSLWFVDQSCMYTKRHPLRTAVCRVLFCALVLIWHCVFGMSVQKSASSSPYLAGCLSETPDEAHLALLLTLQQGQSLGQMLPYHLAQRLVWRTIVYNKETS